MTKKMYNEFTLPHEVLEDPKFNKLKISSKALYMYLGKLQNRYGTDDGWFWRSQLMLIQDTGMSKNTINRAKKELIKSGYLETKRGKFVHNKHRAPDYYRLNGYRMMA